MDCTNVMYTRKGYYFSVCFLGGVQLPPSRWGPASASPAVGRYTPCVGLDPGGAGVLHTTAHTATVSRSERSRLIRQALRVAEIEIKTSASGVAALVCAAISKGEERHSFPGL